MMWHAEAFDAFVRKHGLPPVTLETRRQIDGKRNSEILPMLFGRDMTRDEMHAYEREKEGAYRTLSTGRVRPTAGAARLLDALDAHGVPVAIATSAPAENVVHTLREIGFDGRLTIIARSDEVGRGKPAPDVYLRAAQLAGVPPDTCLAFEDAPIGVASARAAGMMCVAVTTTFSEVVFNAADSPPDGACADFDAYLAGAGRWLTGSASESSDQ